ncbi:MAG: hypothetical protein J6D47_00535 [Peptostreptococcaceae bacterium]|nr:hypothetical protein [Peptostreptococcaceae bacterium]
MQIIKKVERASEIREDISKDIVSSMLNGQKFKILVDGMMSIGKTYLINELTETYKDVDMINILVAPTQLLCEQVSNKYPIFNLVIAGCVYNGEKSIVTTPDSLPKIIENIEGKPFILYVDEAHKIIDDSLYRWNAYKNIDKYADYDNCLGQIFTTATAENLYELFEFTTVYDLRGKNREAQELEILVVDRLDYKTKKAILNSYKDTENQTIYYNNNVKELEKLSDLLNNETRISKETLIHEEINIKHEHLCSQNKKISTVAVELTKNSTIPKDIKYFGFTSAGDAGIEIYTEKVCDFIAFADKNTFTFNGEIQANGRIRTNVDKITIVVEKSDKPADKILSWREYRQLELEKANKDYNKYLEFWDYAKANDMECEVINSLINFNETRGYKNSFEYEEGKIILNKYKLEKLIWSNYWKLVLTRPSALLNKFKSSKTITAKKYTVREFNPVLNEHDKKMIKEQEEQEAQKQLEKGNLCSIYMKELLSLDDDIITGLFNKDLSIEENKDDYKKLTFVKDYKRTRYTSIKNLKRFNVINELELYKMFLDEKITNKYIFELEAIENRKVYKNLYKENKLDLLMTKKTDRATEYYLIRKFFEDDKGKLKKDRLTSNKLRLLFEYLKENGNISKKKEFKKANEEKLLETLSTIFTIKNNKVTSLLKNN